MELIFATNNSHKLKEIGALLGNEIRLLTPAESGITDEIPEEFPTIEENALAKAWYIHRLTGRDVFADDTGLEIEALGGEPGVHSARYAGPGKDFERNIDKVLEKMKGITHRNACFRTVIALIMDGREYLFEGKICGKIISERRGSQGFGYDPVFIPDGYNATFAQMTLEEKNRISHRSEAFRKLRSFLLKERPGAINDIER